MTSGKIAPASSVHLMLAPMSRCRRRGRSAIPARCGAAQCKRGERGPVALLALQHGMPAAKPQGSDRRTAKIEGHAGLILAGIEREPNPTLAELQTMLVAQGERQYRNAMAVLRLARDYA